MRLPTLFFLAFTIPRVCSAQAAHPNTRAHTAQPSPDAIWTEPTDIPERDLFLGSMGQHGRAQGRLTFVREDMSGTKPKFYVVDETGQRWKVKLGSEAQPEVVATRLVWAVGYFTDDDYYEPSIRVDGLQRLRRGQSYVSGDGTVRGARLERSGRKTDGHWDWFDNPHVGTTELNGLRL